MSNSLTDELNGEIKRLVDDATTGLQAGAREDLFDRYMGEPDKALPATNSKFIDTTIADAVEAILPDLMDVFSSTERLVLFDPVGPEDEVGAGQETDVCNHIFWEKNEGFENLYVWVKEALVQQNSYCWSGWDEKEDVSIEDYEDLSLEDLTRIVGDLDGEYEFLEQSGFKVEVDEITGDEIAVPVVGPDGAPQSISVKLRCVKKEKVYRIEPFPQEEFFGTPQWNRVSLSGIPCCGRKREMRKEELLAMGFSKESVERASGGDDEEQKNRRHNTEDSEEGKANENTITIHETYLNVDFYGKGRLSLVKAWLYGDGAELLQWEGGKDAIEEVSHIQISALTPYLVPHRHIGRSVAELVADIQQVKTVLMRHLLDSTYLTNYPRPYFDENEAAPNTYADLADPKPGAPVRTGGADIQWFTPQPIAHTVTPILERMDQLKEERTGATRYNQGLDAESLNKTVGGMSMIMNASQKKTKLIARTIAETGLRDLFLRMHADLRNGPMKEIATRLRGEWVNIDPRTWKRRTDMTVEVGMGRGDRDELRQGLTALGQVQRELQMGGSRMVSDTEIYNTISRVAGTFGIKDITPYVKDPAKLEPMPPAPPPPPDPRVIDMQMRAQAAALKHQADEAERQRAHERAMLELQIKQAAEERQQAKTASDIQTDAEKQDLDEKKAIMDDDFKRDKLEVDAATGYHRADTKTVQSAPPVDYDSVTTE